ncbi:hypothetical protein EVAR_59351_1 [Eumeta japonica]|uniref:Uncharacterized protein n=1 Tax=Eumeta variegata TaxID=151549 RepID=A0A4C2A1D2_EUMVA|nr:hypothetical protein EVAR_59351_1 [Eumeta japonica]
MNSNVWAPPAREEGAFSTSQRSRRSRRSADNLNPHLAWRPFASHNALRAILWENYTFLSLHVMADTPRTCAGRAPASAVGGGLK